MEQFKRNETRVDVYGVKSILRRFVKSIEAPTVIAYEITDSSIVNLYSNRPGVIIGLHGKNIDNIKTEMQETCNVKDVKVFEIRNIVSNCIIN